MLVGSPSPRPCRLSKHLTGTHMEEGGGPLEPEKMAGRGSGSLTRIPGFRRIHSLVSIYRWTNSDRHGNRRCRRCRHGPGCRERFWSFVLHPVERPTATSSWFSARVSLMLKEVLKRCRTSGGRRERGAFMGRTTVTLREPGLVDSDSSGF